jgi:branched-chain amino acid aminotransferase
MCTIIVDDKIQLSLPIIPMESVQIYEVIRIIDKTPLFFSSHLERLNKGLQKSFNRQIDAQSLCEKIKKIVTDGMLTNGNIKVVFYETSDKVLHSIVHAIPHTYPTPENYKSGISTQLLFAERMNPQLKIWQSELREKANKLIDKTIAYEVLLVNKQGNITEGSRSNVLFIKDNTIISPIESSILSGITRKHIIELINNQSQLRYIEQEINISILHQFDAAFITGTSLHILPIKTIGNNLYSSLNKNLACLIKRFNNIVLDDIKKFSYENCN